MTKNFKASRTDRVARRVNLQVLACLLLAILTSLAYSKALHLPFVRVDDPIYVTDNDHVRAGLTLKTFTWALTSTEGVNWFPLTWLSHALDCQVYGLNAGGHHFTNLLLHVLNVVILFLLLMRGSGGAVRSFLVAALWAIHPFNVESVAWVSERKNLLSTLFFLLAIGAYGCGRSQAGHQTLSVYGFTVRFRTCFEAHGDHAAFRALATGFLAAAKNRRLGQATGVAAIQAPFSRSVRQKAALLPFCAGSTVITVIAQGDAVKSLDFYSFGEVGKRRLLLCNVSVESVLSDAICGLPIPIAETILMHGKSALQRCFYLPSVA